MHIITMPEFDITKAYIDPIAGLHMVFPYNDSIKNSLFEIQALEIPISRIHGILAAPPCTMFSRARTTAKTPRDFDGAMAIVEACLRIIWECRKHGPLKWWALENPMGFLRQFLGNPAYSFQPWQFGDQHFKFTDLWGYFNKPGKKRGAHKPKEFDRARWASPKKPPAYAHLKLDRAGIRSITPEKFAKAFCRANP